MLDIFYWFWQRLYNILHRSTTQKISDFLQFSKNSRIFQWQMVGLGLSHDKTYMKVLFSFWSVRKSSTDSNLVFVFDCCDRKSFNPTFSKPRNMLKVVDWKYRTVLLDVSRTSVRIDDEKCYLPLSILKRLLISSGSVIGPKKCSSNTNCRMQLNSVFILCQFWQDKLLL